MVQLISFYLCSQPENNCLSPQWRGKERRRLKGGKASSVVVGWAFGRVQVLGWAGLAIALTVTAWGSALCPPGCSYSPVWATPSLPTTACRCPLRCTCMSWNVKPPPPLLFPTSFFSYHILWQDVLFVYNSSSPCLFPKWACPPTDSGLGYVGEWCVQVLSRGITCVFPLLSSCPLPEPQALAKGDTPSLFHVDPNPGPKSREAQPNRAQPQLA